MSLEVSINLELMGVQTNPADLTTPTNKFRPMWAQSLLDGSGAGEVGVEFEDRRSISANDDLDLTALVNSLKGVVSAFAAIHYLAIKAADANTQNLLVGNAAANPFAGWISTAGTVTVRPGEKKVLIWCGDADATRYPVVNASSDILRVAPVSGTQVYEIWILGV